MLILVLLLLLGKQEATPAEPLPAARLPPHAPRPRATPRVICLLLECIARAAACALTTLHALFC
jgi:hypothetical protein